MSKCSDTRKFTSEFADITERLDKQYDEFLKNEHPEYEEISNNLNETAVNDLNMNRYNKNIMPEDRFDETVNLPEKENVILKIFSILNNDSLLKEDMQAFIFDTVLLKSNKKLNLKDKSIKLKDTLDTLDISVLKNIFAALVKRQNIMTGGNKDAFAQGRIGDIFIAYKTPDRLGRIEKSGSIAMFSNVIKDYARNISNNIQRFWGYDLDAKKRGIEDIIEQVSFLEVADKEKQLKQMTVEYAEQDIQSKKIAFFSFYARGIIRKNENGKFEIATDYGPIRRDDNTLDRYDNGDIKYQLSNYVPIETFEDGYYDIQFKNKSLETLESLMSEYRELNKQAYNNIVKDFESSVKQLALSFDKAFPQLSKTPYEYQEKGFQIETNLLEMILFGKNTELRAQAIEDAKSILPQDKIDLLDKMVDTFGNFISDTRVMSMSDNIEESRIETYYPVLYSIDFVQRQFMNIRNDIERQLETIDADIELRPSKELLDKREELEIALNKIVRAESTLRNSPEDISSAGTKILFQSGSRNFKSVSGLLDIRNMRTDSGVYYDYLKYNYSQIERNKLTANLIEALAKTDNPEVQQYLIDQYNIPFGGKNTATRLGVLNIPASDKAEKFTRLTSSIITYALLGKIGSGLVNSTAALQNIYKSSWNETFGAMSTLSNVLNNPNDAEAQFINKLIKRSGVADIGNFFGEAIVDKIAETRLEQEVTSKILSHILVYVNEANKRPSAQKELQQELNDLINEELKKSNKFFESVEITLESDPELNALQRKQIKEAIKLNKEHKRQSLANSLTNYTINKQIPIFNHLTQITENDKSILKRSKDSLLRLLLASKGAYTKAPFIKKVSMGQTETLVRSIPFIIGYNRAKQRGLVNPKKTFEEYSENEIDTLIKIGTLYSDKANYSLSTTGLGAAFWGSWARIVTKIAPWSNQKMQDDIDNIKGLYNYYKNVDKIEKDKFDALALGKTLLKSYAIPVSAVAGATLGATIFGPVFGAIGGALSASAILAGQTFTAKNKDLYVKNETTKFIAMQGITTLATDLLFFGAKKPFNLIRNKLYGNIAGSSLQRAAGGFSSDLLSLMYMPLMIMLKSLFMEEEDKEFVHDELRYYLRRLPLGFGVQYALENTLIMLGVINENYEAKELYNIVRPAEGLVPGKGTTTSVIKNSIEALQD